MPNPPDTAPDFRRSIERHYDSLAFLYRAFWGEHIHHGLWPGGASPARTAQEQLVAYLARRADVRPGERVLDVGCGYAAPARWLSGHLGCHVTGITISRKQARLATRYNIRDGQHDRVTLVRADAASLPFADATFDVIWVIECIEHLVDKRRFFTDSARMLRGGGRLALCSWQRCGRGLVEDALVRRVCESFLCPSLATADEYADWCVAAGLRLLLAEDLTTRVRATWRILNQRLGRPWLKPLRPVLNGDLRRFLAGFPAIARAYDCGAMTYGLLVAAKNGEPAAAGPAE